MRINFGHDFKNFVHVSLLFVCFFLFDAFKNIVIERHSFLLVVHNFGTQKYVWTNNFPMLFLFFPKSSKDTLSNGGTHIFAMTPNHQHDSSLFCTATPIGVNQRDCHEMCYIHPFACCRLLNYEMLDWTNHFIEKERRKIPIRLGRSRRRWSAIKFIVRLGQAGAKIENGVGV